MIDHIPLTIGHHFAGGVYAKEHSFPSGHVMDMHTHGHEHMSILAQGEVILSVDGERTLLKAPACITIPDAPHSITTLTPVRWFCIWRADIAEDKHVDISGH